MEHSNSREGEFDDAKKKLIERAYDEMYSCFRFHPKEEDLVYDYLLGKVTCSPVLFGRLSNPFQDISAPHFYMQHPKEFVSKLLNKRVWYFFIQQDENKSQNEEIRKLENGVGFWQMEKPAYLMQKSQGLHIGYKRSFRLFRTSRGKAKQTHWRMVEYELAFHGSKSSDTKNTKWTLARVSRGTEYELD